MKNIMKAIALVFKHDNFILKIAFLYLPIAHTTSFPHRNSKNDLNPNDRVQGNASSFLDASIDYRESLPLPVSSIAPPMHLAATTVTIAPRIPKRRVRRITNAWNIERGRGSRWHENRRREWSGNWRRLGSRTFTTQLFVVSDVSFRSWIGLSANVSRHVHFTIKLCNFMQNTIQTIIQWLFIISFQR